jgi:hypothetical protein
MTLLLIAPIAAVSLDMTAALAPLLYGLMGLVGLSALGIVLSCVAPQLSWPRRTVQPWPGLLRPAHKLS